MNIVRNILAVVVGYLIFAVSAVLLFQLAGIDPHSDISTSMMAIIIIYGMLFAFIGGYTTQWISKSSTLTINYVLAGIMAAFAAFSLFKASGNHYSQLAAIFLFAPMSVVGGVVRLKRVKK